MNDIITIELPSKPEYVSIARLTASVIANQCGFDFDDIEDIKVAVGEACNNAVLHSGSQNSTYKINYYVENDQYKIKVIDQGTGFNLKDYHEPDLEHPKVGGLGIFIMKSLMDEVDVLTTPDKGTAITLIKNII
jgi:serine/threonine-protein kinase RsbW